MIRFFCLEISKAKTFNYINTIIIIINCIITLIFITEKNSNAIPLVENFFLLYYIIEMMIKILGKSLYCNKTSYFRNGWNIIDFIIIISSLIIIFIPSVTFNISVFRIIRILNALDIRQLKITVEGMLASFSLMKETVLILLSFMTVYSILGLHLFSDLFNRRCFSPKFGIEIKTKAIPYCKFNLCTDEDSICGDLLKGNPDFGITNFDNFYSSFLQVFRIMTFNDWTILMNLTQKTYSNTSIVYFISLALLGNFFVLNLILGVLKMKYSECVNQTIILQIENSSDSNPKYDLKLIKLKNFYHKFILNKMEVYKITTKRDNYVTFKKSSIFKKDESVN